MIDKFWSIKISNRRVLNEIIFKATNYNESSQIFMKFLTEGCSNVWKWRNISQFGKNILMLSVVLNSKDVKDTKMYRVNLELR